MVSPLVLRPGISCLLGVKLCVENNAFSGVGHTANGPARTGHAPRASGLRRAAEAPRFGQLLGRSVFNTPTGYHPFSLKASSVRRVGPLTPSLHPLDGFGATAAAARLSSRAGRAKPRHAKDGAAILCVLAGTVPVPVQEGQKNRRSRGRSRFGHGQRASQQESVFGVV